MPQVVDAHVHAGQLADGRLALHLFAEAATCCRRHSTPLRVLNPRPVRRGTRSKLKRVAVVAQDCIPGSAGEPQSDRDAKSEVEITLRFPLHMEADMRIQKPAIRKADCLWLVRIAALLVLLTGLQIPDVQAKPVLVLDSNHELLGANGVVVDGWSYDVRFVESSCDFIWSGCVRDRFLFKSEAAATAASHALLDQVLLDIAPHLQFDTVPWATYGIEGDYAQIITPFDSCNTPYQCVYKSVWAFNSSNPDHDQVFTVGVGQGQANFSMKSTPVSTFAVWTVSEPTSLTLLVIGIAGFAFHRRK